MNTILTSDAVAALLRDGPTALAALAVKSAALALAAALAALALRRASFAARHLVWLLAVFGLLLLPPLSVIGPAWHLPSRPAASGPTAPALHPAGAVHVTLPPALQTAPPIETAPPVWPYLLTAAWLLGACLLLTRLAWGALAAARLTRRCLRVADSRHGEEMRRLRTEAGGCRPVVLRQGDGAAVPMTIGWLRPVVLLPTDADDWPAERRQAALRHELAHVRRGDWLWHTLAAIACAVYWPNPLVWLCARRLRAESEGACDDAVLASGTRATDYAAHLLEIARRLAGAAPPATAVAMASRPQIEGRLRAILSGARDRRGLTRRRSAVFLLVAALALVPLAALRLAAQDGKPAPDLRAEAERVTSESNLRQIALGVIVYTQNHGGHLPDADKWTDEIAPFWGAQSILPELLHDPAAPGHHASDYAFNRALSGLDIGTLKDPSHTVLLFESTTGTRNAADTGQSLPSPGRHEGGSVFAYADGKVHWVPDGQPQLYTPFIGAPAPSPFNTLTGAPRGTAVLTGRVIFQDGRPAPDVHVGAQIQNAAEQAVTAGHTGVFSPMLQRILWADAFTGPDGRYRLTGLTDLPYNVAVVPHDLMHEDDSRSPWVAAALEGATGQEGKTVTLPDLVLTPGGFVTGTVADAAGKPFAGVSVGSYGPERPASSAMIISSRTDAAGHYRLRVAPGTSRVYIADERWLAASATLTVAEGQTKAADFQVTPGRK